MKKNRYIILPILFCAIYDFGVDAIGKTKPKAQGEDFSDLFQDDIPSPTATSPTPNPKSNSNSPKDDDSLEDELTLSSPTSKKYRRQDLNPQKPPTNPVEILEGSATGGAAEALYNDKKFTECKATLWKQIQNLSNAELITLGKCHLELKEPDEAIKVADMVLAKSKKNLEAFVLKGNAYVLQKRHGDAVDAFREATVVSPTFEPAWEALISLYIDRKNNYELSLIYEEMIKKIGRRGPYLTELCKINTQERIYPTAIKYCKEAQAKNPQDADSMVYLGLAYRNSEQLEQGANTLKNAATQFTDSELAQVTYAQHLSEEKNYIDAYTHFLAATQINDKNIDSLVGLGTAAAKIKKIDESLAAFTKACKINRSAGVGLRKAASEFFKTNQKEEYNKLMELSEKCQ